ncbi:Crp/Fnr family transcriptional regulator [Adhaeribacter sp. BT258]|uniref:Crp/Fnr family transcriptional regulator n=1 Tax=Adhaeribacter terrigena TaxID=2793070 RepID=A0ABS1C4B0_9BACT|nr:Crp/Fnr family transcriptional regulator [Adhaeribacter terrigena]MBK0404192.1 Crp/Fnr family transcriptional regulator [Adhaeribacter terrigena]
MKALLSRISAYYPLPETSLKTLSDSLQKVELPKGHLLFKAGKTDRNLYFIEKGIARAFCFQNEKEVTFWFGSEGDAVLSFNSYIAGKPGYENIELLEASVLYKIEHAVLQQFFATDIALANWGRKMAERELVKTEERFISRQFKTASERYHELITRNPQLLQRVQLGHIASFLGVTQVTLSRIRSENS